MEYIRIARAIGGLFSVIFLLIVLGAHVLLPGVEVGPYVVGVALSLIGGLLAVDVFRQELPGLKVSLTRNGTQDEKNNDN